MCVEPEKQAKFLIVAFSFISITTTICNFPPIMVCFIEVFSKYLELKRLYETKAPYVAGQVNRACLKFAFCRLDHCSSKCPFSIVRRVWHHSIELYNIRILIQMELLQWNGGCYSCPEQPLTVLGAFRGTSWSSSKSEFQNFLLLYIWMHYQHSKRKNWTQ